MMFRVFNHETFWKPFFEDLDRAAGLVIIQSPYLAKDRICKVRAALARCVRRRVNVCVFVQHLKNSGSAEKYESEQERLRLCIGLLRSEGVHVTVRPQIHEKLIVVDESILWDGCLNVLSYRDTKERMTRFASKEMAQQAIVDHALTECDYCNLRTVITAADQRKQLGTDVTERRKAMRFSQNELSEKTGISQSVISEIEGGEKDVGLNKVLRICEALELNLRSYAWYFGPAMDQLIGRRRQSDDHER